MNTSGIISVQRGLTGFKRSSSSTGMTAPIANKGEQMSDQNAKIPSFSGTSQEARAFVTLLLRDLKGCEEHFGLEIYRFNGGICVNHRDSSNAGFSFRFHYSDEGVPHIEMLLRLEDKISLSAAKRWTQYTSPDAIKHEDGHGEVSFEFSPNFSRALEEAFSAITGYLGFYNNELYLERKKRVDRL